MKIIFNHDVGVLSGNDNCLLEVECYREHESIKFMFENGWLPYKNDIWYQCRSSRLKLTEISTRRKKELSKINVSTKGNLQKIIENSKPFGCFNEELLKFYLSLPNYTFFMDDVAVGVVNFFDSEIFFSSFVWDKNYKKNSYGTLSYYYLIDMFKKTYNYIYISEFYPKYEYKKKLPGFQYWNGKTWN
jgi:hypothetical protein